MKIKLLELISIQIMMLRVKFLRLDLSLD